MHRFCWGLRCLIAALAACLFGFSPFAVHGQESNPQLNVPDGTFVMGSGPTIYWIQDGSKHEFPDWDTYISYGGATDLNNVRVLSDEDLAGIPDGDPVARPGPTAGTTSAASASGEIGSSAPRPGRLADADQAIADRDYYIAAMNLEDILNIDPSYGDALSTLASIAPNIPGGLIHREQPVSSGPNSHPPYTVEWATNKRTPIPNWPSEGEFRQASRDGAYALLGFEAAPAVTAALDLRTGALIYFPDQWMLNYGFLAAAGNQVVQPGDFWGTAPLKLVNLPSKSPRTLCQIGSGYETYWANNTTLVSQGWDGVNFVDIKQGKCDSVKLPGWDRTSMRVSLTPDGQSILIYTSDALLAAQRNGSNIRKIADWSEQLKLTFSTPSLSTDGSTALLSQYLVSTRTGRVYDFANDTGDTPAVAWLDQLPQPTSNNPPSIALSPPSGARGTIFTLQISGGAANQTFDLQLTSPSGKQTEQSGALDSNGRATIVVLKSGLGDEGGTYTLLVHTPAGDGNTSFTIAD